MVEDGPVGRRREGGSSTGRPLAELDGGLTLAPWQIVTVRIEEA